MKLLLPPLAILTVIGLLAWMGLGSADEFSGTLYDNGVIGAGGYPGWYDANGHLVLYNNMTLAGESGTFRAPQGGFFFQQTEAHYYWWNETISPTKYEIFNTPNAENKVANMDTGFDITDSLGIISIIGAVMVMATIAGIRVLGIGVSDTSVSTLIKGSALVTVWLLFSAMSMPLIVLVPIVGAPLYFILTLIYTLGVINQVGGGGGE